MEHDAASPSRQIVSAGRSERRAGNSPSRPRAPLTVLDGGGMTADEIAWAMIAAAAEKALTIPGLPAATADRMVRLAAASLRAGVPPQR